jgi:hypothetical protein
VTVLPDPTVLTQIAVVADDSGDNIQRAMQGAADELMKTAQGRRKVSDIRFRVLWHGDAKRFARAAEQEHPEHHAWLLDFLWKNPDGHVIVASVVVLPKLEVPGV